MLRNMRALGRKFLKSCVPPPFRMDFRPWSQGCHFDAIGKRIVQGWTTRSFFYRYEINIWYSIHTSKMFTYRTTEIYLAWGVNLLCRAICFHWSWRMAKSVSNTSNSERKIKWFLPLTYFFLYLLVCCVLILLFVSLFVKIKNHCAMDIFEFELRWSFILLFACGRM